MLEKAGASQDAQGQGKLTPELFQLIEHWYFNSQAADRAGPGFYIASEPFSTMAYGESLIVARVESDEAAKIVPDSPEDDKRIKKRVDAAVEANRRDGIPLIGRYFNWDDGDWFVISRPLLASDPAKITLIPLDERSPEALKEDIRQSYLGHFQRSSTGQKLNALSYLGRLFGEKNHLKNPWLAIWFREMLLPFLRPTVERALDEFEASSDVKPNFTRQLRRSIFSMLAAGDAKSLDCFKRFLRILLSKLERIGHRSDELYGYDLAASLARQMRSAWKEDAELRSLVAEYLNLPAKEPALRANELVSRGDRDLSLRAVFGMPISPEYLLDLELSPTHRKRPLPLLPDVDYLNEESGTDALTILFEGSANLRALIRRRAENLWPALAGRLAEVGSGSSFDFARFAHAVLSQHLKNLADDPQAQEAFLRLNEERLIAFPYQNFRFLGWATTAALLVENWKMDFGFPPDLRERVFQSVRRMGMEILKDATARTTSGMFPDTSVVGDASLIDLLWTVMPEHRGKFFQYYFDHFTKWFYVAKKYQIGSALFQEPRTAYEKLNEVLRAGLSADLFPSTERSAWVQRAVLPVPGSPEYSELARLFVLVDPAFVSEDVRLMNASQPQYRFNEDYRHDASVWRQPSWENHTLAWYFLAPRLRGVTNETLEGTVRLLLNGGVENSFRTELYEIFSSKSHRGERRSEIDPELLRSRARKAELERFFKIQTEGGRAFVLFKNAEEILDAFPGIRKKFSQHKAKLSLVESGMKFPQAVVDWILQSVVKTKDPLRRAARILHLLPKLHPYRNTNGRLARLWASLVLVQAGYPIPVGLPTYDFGLTETDLYDEVRKAIRLGTLWQAELAQAQKAGIPAEEFFQKHFRNSPLEGAVHWMALSPAKLKRELDKNETMPPQWSAKLASYLDNAFYYQHEKGDRIAYFNEEQRRRIFASLQRQACQELLNSR